MNAAAGSHPPQSSGGDPLGPPKRWPSRFRLRILWAIVGTGISLAALDWFWTFEDVTWQVILFWSILAGTTFLVALWWLFLSGFAWKRRLVVFGTAAVLVAAYVGLFRFKGFSGDLVPRFEIRWQQFAEQKAADYWKNHGTSDPRIGGRPESVADSSKPADDFDIQPGDWPQFEGPNRDGIARGLRVRTDWEQRPPLQVWRHPVGAGWSSFAIGG